MTVSYLGRRGWALQERLPSNKILHFEETQVWWECRIEVCCEKFPSDVPSVVSERPRWVKVSPDDLNIVALHVRNIDGRKNKLRSMAEELSVLRTRDRSAIVETYTRTGLSRDTDRPMAIFALGQETQKVLRDESVAGSFYHHNWSGMYTGIRLASVPFSKSNEYNLRLRPPGHGLH